MKVPSFYLVHHVVRSIIQLTNIQTNAAENITSLTKKDNKLYPSFFKRVLVACCKTTRSGEWFDYNLSDNIADTLASCQSDIFLLQAYNTTRAVDRRESHVRFVAAACRF